MFGHDQMQKNEEHPLVKEFAEGNRFRNDEEERKHLEQMHNLEQYNKEAVAQTEADKLKADNLLASKKTFGDSALMKEVKSQIAEIEKLMDTVWKGEITFDDLNQLGNRYFQAIKSCESYLDNRSASSGKGLERRKLVEENKNRLIRETELISETAELMRMGRISGKLTGKGTDDSGKTIEVAMPLTLRDLLFQTRIYNLMPAPEEKVGPEKVVRDDVKDSVRSFLGIFKASDVRFKDKNKQQGYADEVLKLRRVLKCFPEGKAFSAYIECQGQQVLISQDERGVLTVDADGSRSVIKENVSELIEKLDLKIIEESDVMRPEALKDVVGDLKYFRSEEDIPGLPRDNYAGNIQKATLRLSRYLQKRTGLSAAYFANYSPDELKVIASLASETSDIDAFTKELKSSKGYSELEKKQINTTEILQLLRSKSFQEGRYDDKVKYKQEKKSLTDNGWKKDEAALLSFLSDLYFSMDTWKADEVKAKPGERVRSVLLQHKDILAQLITESYLKDNKAQPNQAKVINRLVARMPSEGMGIDPDALKESINALIEPMKSKIPTWLGNPDKEMVKNFLGMGLKDNQANDELIAVDVKLDQMVTDSTDKIQEKIIAQMEQVFSGTREETVNWRTIGDPEEKEIDITVKKARVQKGKEALDKMSNSCIRGNSGQGLFIKNIFSNYFKGASILDKRCMMASAFRALTPVDKQDEDDQKAAAGKFLGGILKGAGPLFQKLLQGLPTDSMPKEIKEALSDMKSRLAPIPEEIVKAQLLGMVERSEGKITSIEVTKSLGSASVGQAFKCTIYGPEFKEGKKVVVKLLKPDVRNRMAREKGIMLECARQTDRGMVATYEGQLERIEEELDLTIEARNIDKGRLYDGDDGVMSVIPVDMIEATTTSLMMEEAKGDTVDIYVKNTEETIKERDNAMAFEYPKQLENESEEDFEKRNKKIRDEYFDKMNRMREDIAKDLVQLIKRQKYLTNLAEKWVEEGIFGKGFYHGDLHAGNMMITDEGLTVIDFGNATSLTDEQKIQVTRMVAAAAAGEVDDFQDGLHKLLRKEFDGLYKDRAEDLKMELSNIFMLGDQNCAGQRIAVALLKAQELGLEVPSAIFNFSQSQLRLQNAIDDMNRQIEAMKMQLDNIDKNFNIFGFLVEEGSIYDQIMSSMAGTWLHPTDSDDALKRVYESFLWSKYRRFIQADTDDFRDAFLKDSLYGMYLSRYEQNPVIDDQSDNSKTKYGIKTIAFSKVTEYITKILQKPDAPIDKDALRKEMLEILAPCEVASNVGKVITKIQSMLEDIKNSYMNDEKVDATFYTKALDEVMKGLEEDYKRFIDNKVKPVVSGYNEMQEVLKKKDIDDESRDAAMSEFMKIFEPLRQEFNMYSSGKAVIEINGFKMFLRTSKSPEAIKNAINSMAKDAGEAGEKLTKAYDSYRTYQTEHPDEELVGSEIEKEVIKAAVRATGAKLKELRDNLGTIRTEHPKNFVDVMGETISKYINESLYRLGYFNSLKYQKKLNAK